ncbi:hypothetical protein EC988_001627 [Linderina pennispora]|nr:hypothetical protein EC988_001627 [Linderina pennispora]
MAITPKTLIGEIRKGHELDVAKLEAFLQREIKKELAMPLTIKQFNVGQSNPTYLIIDSSGRKFVLRKKPAGQLLSKTAHAVEREYRVLDALGRHSNVPVPRVYALCEDPSVIGTPFYLMEFLEGRIFPDARLPEVPPHERPQYWSALVSTLAKLHKVDYKAVGLEGYGRPSGYYERQLRSLSKVEAAQAAATDKHGYAVGSLQRLDELKSWFSQRECPDETAIVHGDFKMDNVMWHKTRPEIIGILDWELSTLGNPRTDLANLLQPLLTPYNMPGPFKGLKDAPASEFPPDEQVLLGQYCMEIGRPYPLAGWDYAVVFGLFRNAVIMQGVAARLAKGQASSSFANIVAKQFPVVMALAMSVADGSFRTKQSKL